MPNQQGVQNPNYCTPFREFLFKDQQGFFNLRVGSKNCLVKTNVRIDSNFNWSLVQIIDEESNQPRLITSKELSLWWLKPNIKALVNYQVAVELGATTSALMNSERLKHRRNKRGG